MAKKKVSALKALEQASVADVLYKDFENLPGEIRHYLTRYSGSTDEVRSVAHGINAVIGEVNGTSSADALRQAASLVRAHVAHAHRALFELQCFAGTLDGLAWAVDVRSRSETFFEP